MKYLFSLLFLGLLSLSVQAQDAEVVKLSQSEGIFEQTSLQLNAGTYVFEVSNLSVDHEVGFVLVPQGGTTQDDHIKEAYLKKTIANGETAQSSEVKLKKGTYEYFCPMNPTPKYTLVVN